MGAVTRQRTVDWESILGELQREGMAMKAIGRKVGLSPQALSNLKYGRTNEPAYSIGLKLIELHRKIVGIV